FTLLTYITDGLFKKWGYFKRIFKTSKKLPPPQISMRFWQLIKFYSSKISYPYLPFSLIFAALSSPFLSCCSASF
ncbi:MAG: hypothetical protein K6A71_04240, partial [Lachnospiraceae bacterium]|nr:hypothetical protein [Lachnospiraceae bacterium]